MCTVGCGDNRACNEDVAYVGGGAHVIGIPARGQHVIEVWHRG